MTMLTIRENGRARSRSLRAAAVSVALVAPLLAVAPSGAAGPGDEAETIVGLAPAPAPPDSERIDASRVDVSDGSGVAVHPWTGEVYYVEQDNHRIRRIDRDNRVLTVVGDGIAGFSGDGGPADQARLNTPKGIAFDGDGNLYVADSLNNRVRRIDTLGFISTVAGGGTGDGPTVLNPLGDGDVASNAVLNQPHDVAVTEDGRFLLIADTFNHRIRRVNGPALPAPVIYTVAGNSQGFSGDGDYASYSHLDHPTGVAVGPYGRNVLIADSGNRRIRQIYPNYGIETIAGDGDPGRPAEAGLGTEESVGTVADVAFDHDYVPYFSSLDSNEVFRIEDGRTFRVSGLGGGDAGTADNRTYVDPDALAFDRSGNLFIADSDEIVKIVDPNAIPAPARVNPFGRPAEDEVKRLYRAAFGREPDAIGHRFWLETYQSGSSIESLAEYFLASAESEAIYDVAADDGSEFIRTVYLNVLGREPDDDGFAYWLEELRSGMSHAVMVVSFSNSPENITGTGTGPPIDAQGMRIIRLYRAAFGRFPDVSGANYWYGQLLSGVSAEFIAQQFLNSSEASELLPTEDNSDFVDGLYKNVLGRVADTDGAAYWLAQLDSGAMTHAQVLLALADSSENLIVTGTA